MYCLDSSSDLPPGVSLGTGARVVATNRLHIEQGVSIGDGSVVAGETVTLGKGAKIGTGCDLRAGELMLSPGCEISRGVSILVAERFELGPASRVSEGCHIVCRDFKAGRFLYLGQQCAVGYGGTNESSATVALGDDVALGPHTILNANHPVELGDRVGSGSHVSLWTHGFHFGHSILDGYRATFAPIRIEPNVWLGYHATVLPGVSIGMNTIVAAGAVVTADMPGDYLVGGVPARAIKPLAPQSLSSDEREAMVVSVLDLWANELTYKGIRVRDTTYHGAAWARSIGGCFFEEQVVAFVPEINQARSVRSMSSNKSAIVLTFSSISNIQPGCLEDKILMSISDKKIDGDLGRLGHDLRDKLRRHTIVFNYDSVYSSIEPEAFRKLRDL
ncbi:MAG: DapH/DapD/GlmU-related protein [Pseudomonadota bacterium]